MLNAPRGQDRPSEQALPGLTVGRQWAANEDTSSVPLLRCLPLAGTAIVAGPAEVSQWCALSAALTHGNADALISTSFLGVMVGGAHLTSVFREGAQELDPATATSWLMREHPGCELIDRVISVLADSEPWSAQRLAELSPRPLRGIGADRCAVPAPPLPGGSVTQRPASPAPAPPVTRTPWRHSPGGLCWGGWNAGGWTSSMSTN